MESCLRNDRMTLSRDSKLWLTRPKQSFKCFIDLICAFETPLPKCGKIFDSCRMKGFYLFTYSFFPPKKISRLNFKHEASKWEVTQEQDKATSKSGF